MLNFCNFSWCLRLHHSNKCKKSGGLSIFLLSKVISAVILPCNKLPFLMSQQIQYVASSPTEQFLCRQKTRMNKEKPFSNIFVFYSSHVMCNSASSMYDSSMEYKHIILAIIFIYWKSFQFCHSKNIKYILLFSRN